MPLIILGVLVISGIVAYWYIGNQNSDDPVSPRDIGDRVSSAAQEKAQGVKNEVAKKIRRRAGIFDVDYDVEDDGYNGSSKDHDDNTIHFPSDVERAKRQRDIH